MPSTATESTVPRVVVTADHHVQIEQTATPLPGPGQAQVRTVFVGICGSDTHARQGRHPHITLPYHPGHEVVGIITDLGDASETAGFSVGDRVVVEPTLPCWNCKQCRGRNENLCENLNFFGCGHPDGGMTSLFTIATHRLHRIPDDMDDLTAALIEPLATPVHAVRIAGPLTGRAVVILGAGTIGLLLLAVARGQGAARIVVSDPLPGKRDLARKHGADHTVDATGPDPAAEIRQALGESADVIFDCVATQATLDQAITLAAKHGTVVIVGVPTQSTTIDLPAVQDYQLRIQGSATYLAQDYRAAIALLHKGLVPVHDLITARYPLTEAAAAFAAASSGDHIKVLLEGPRSAG